MSPKTTTTPVFESDLTTENFQQPTPETHIDNLYELLQDAPDNYFTKQPTTPKSTQFHKFTTKPPSKIMSQSKFLAKYNPY